MPDQVSRMGAKVEKLLENSAVWIAAVLVAACVLGRLFNKDDAAIVKATGDRVMCGLLALPLIAHAVHGAYPMLPLQLVLLAPAPLLIYTFMLAFTDFREEKGNKVTAYLAENFSRVLFVAVVLFFGAYGAGVASVFSG